MGKDGTFLTIRVLLDTCSTVNFITEKLAKRLKLQQQECNIPVGALNALTTHTKHIVTSTIHSIDGKYKKAMNFLTIPTIADMIPTQLIPRNAIKIPHNLKLADPEFFKPAPIDILLGTGPTLSLLCIGQINLTPEEGPELYLQKTLLGWVLGGSIYTTKKEQPLASCNLLNTDNDLTKFWEIEEITKVSHRSKQEQEAEEHFVKHHTRDASGRYIVALPFNHKQERLGRSRHMALKRYNALEKRFTRDPELKAQYTKVIEEYIQLGHMSKAVNQEEKGAYLPHHAVIKETSLTTKLRVVFDGSAKTSTGISLNDTLLSGPLIQDDLFTLLIRFRCYRYVLTGDIEKMYRQFWVNQADREYQRILWRDHGGQLTTYQLNTITFGLTAAPFLAIRCLQQLANDEGKHFPIAARVLKRDFYVDDMLTGFNTVREAREARDQIDAILKKAGLHMCQWASNEHSLLSDLPRDTINKKLHLTDDKTLKTLGIAWSAQTDEIIYSVKPVVSSSTTTKRRILSDIARIFDPLGLLGPIVFTAKTLIQDLWALKLDWDESIPNHIHTKWINFHQQLNQVIDLTIKRHVLISETTTIQLHGFCDASLKGYGACFYLRSTDKKGNTLTNLLCSKSRVAPLKVISIPRLELCGAHLLAQLYKTIINIVESKIDRTILWTDSMITLHWINSSPHTLKTFVANRVSEIQESTKDCDWRHVKSEDNPADALSRGQQPAEFLNNRQWLYGPEWLQSHESTWRQQPILSPTEDNERKTITCLVNIPQDMTLLTRFSSFNKLTRVIAYCLRFRKINEYKGNLSLLEIKRATTTILKMIQLTEFRAEIQALTSKNPTEVKANSNLKMFNPYIDQDGILRVGGRLQKANLSLDQKHPIILPKNNHVTELIISQEHHKLHHAGMQTTLYSLRQRYWIIDGRNQVKKIIRRCIKCLRVKPPIPQYIMGNLPASRVTGTRPFYEVGVDYCGPFVIKERKIRNRGKIKVYVAVFICMSVKAVHLEVVTDLTTPGFIAALKRFIARRGKPKTINSDNGLNFVGANNELKDIMSQLHRSESDHMISVYLRDQGIMWNFSPPVSPHFGGIWEAAVKSFKHHLKRVVGNELFTFEEFNTLTIEIEAILNSRPLTPMSSDPNDLSVLTPGHFLIGDSLTSLPELCFSQVHNRLLSSWKHIQKVRRDFWTRWHKEYLNELNIRRKWIKGEHTINIGTIVLLRDENLPPLHWKLGRVIEVHPGEDNVIRVVTVKTATGTVQRNVKKIAPLLHNESMKDDDHRIQNKP